MKNTPKTRFAMRDGEYEKQYREWVEQADPETIEKLKRMHLLKPDCGYRVSKGPNESEIIDRQASPPVDWTDEPETPDGVSLMPKVMEVVRIALCDILNPRPGTTMEMEASIVGLAVGALGMGGISEVAKRFGVSRQAISKRVVKFSKECSLPPSVYMKSEANRDKHRLANVRKRRVSNG